jgi:very-short-patch-repair endonuclease
MLPDRRGPVHVVVPPRRRARHRGIQTHRGRRAGGTCDRIPVTSPTETLIDLAACLAANRWEAAVNEADSLDLCTPEDVRAAADATKRPGAATARRLLDRHTFTLTDSEVERLFLPIARAAGLPKPLTRVYVNGWRVDFYWPELKLVVEADGLRYHRTAARQTRDVLRDHAHTLAGFVRLRFTHWQIRFDPGYVRATLALAAATTG